jgi:signal recognition particle subunit SRP54
VAKTAGVALWPATGTDKPLEIVRGAVREAKLSASDVLLVDTAGRLHIDNELMDELGSLKRELSPSEIIFVADAMIGQDAVRSAAEFHKRLALTGIILTKMDGDARGGAALSIRKVTGAPVKFIGVGEKVDALEAFRPDRIVSRILGMGDVLTLIEKTQNLYSVEQAKELEEKFRKNDFTLDDFLAQLRQVRKMGSMTDILKMIPGMSKALPKEFEIPEKDINRIEAIICSMTRQERRRPDVLNASRRRRIAAGSGAQVAEVNRLVKQFEESRKMMKQLGGGKKFRMPTLPGAR